MSNHHNNNNNKLILALDDDLDIVTLIKQALQMQGFKVSAFTNPFKALEELKANCKDCSIIIADIRMPKMNGYEFARKVKEIKKEVKVVLMTALEINEKEFHNILPSIKVDGFLQKPFSISNLKDVITDKINSSS